MASPAALEDLSWREDVQDHLEVWARSGVQFSADDLRKSFRPAPHGNMVGRAFSVAAHRGLIRHVSYKESTTPSRKHSVIRTWVGVVEE